MNVILYATLGFGLGIGAPFLFMKALLGLQAWGLI
jgi:hypothetical protein